MGLGVHPRKGDWEVWVSNRVETTAGTTPYLRILRKIPKQAEHLGPEGLPLESAQMVTDP